MPSKARKAFSQNIKDIEHLIDLYHDKEQPKRSRESELEVLCKSAIVLITAYWESYCEDIASEGLDHIVKFAKSAKKLPNELKKQVAKDMEKENHELAVWELADSGWKGYVESRLETMKEQRNRNLNSPKTERIDDLFLKSLGIKNISSSWKLDRNAVASEVANHLDEFVKLRGAIAHRGNVKEAVTISQVVEYLDLIKNLAAKTGGKVNSHVIEITGKALWIAKKSKE